MIRELASENIPIEFIQHNSTIPHYINYESTSSVCESGSAKYQSLSNSFASIFSTPDNNTEEHKNNISPIMLKSEDIELSWQTMKAKRPRSRHIINKFHSDVLQTWFDKNAYISNEGRKKLSAEIGLPERSIMYWFQNKRRLLKINAGIDHSSTLSRLLRC